MNKRVKNFFWFLGGYIGGGIIVAMVLTFFTGGS